MTGRSGKFRVEGHEALSNGASVDVPESLKPFIVLRPRSPDMLDAMQAAARLEVSRSTVYYWARSRKLLAWKPPGRRLTIPAKQILGPRKVVPGIAEVLDIIDDPELAWTFLTEEWPFADEVAYPLEKLKAGRIEEVVDTAPGFGMVFT